MKNNTYDLKFLTTLNFNYEFKHSNFGLFAPNELFIMYNQGYIMKTRIEENKYPKLVGLFDLEIHNFQMAENYNTKEYLINSLIESNINYIDRNKDIVELSKNIDLSKISKFLFLKNLIIHPDFRGKGITQELIKNIFFTHYIDNTIIVCNAIPLQHNKNEESLYLTDDNYIITVNNDIEYNSKNKNLIIEENHSAKKYFKINNLINNNFDQEISEYKLFNLLTSMNFERVETTNYFYLKEKEKIFQFLESFYEKTS